MTEEVMEEAQRTKEYGDELFLSMDEIEELRNLSHDKLLSYAIGMAEQYREVKKRMEYHEETVQQYGEWLNAAKKYDVDYVMANALTKAWGEVE